MNIRSVLTVAISLVLLVAVQAAVDKAKAKNMAQVHMGHVMDGWKDTPNGKGLLPTAIAEADIAAKHAGFAGKKSGDIGWMKTHIRHVLHAVDPSVEPKGPGLGYGTAKAAAGAKKHIDFAAGSPGASKNVKAHRTHVATSLDNSTARVTEIVKLCQEMLAANSPATAAAHVNKVKILVGQLLEGVDANGDGKISWKKGEGGLKEAAKHMGFMKKGEGMM